MPTPDKIDQLYDALKADGAVNKSRENFRSYMLASGKQGYMNRKQLYDALKADGAVESATYDEFRDRLGLHAVKPQQPVARPSSTPQSVQQQPQKPQPKPQKAKQQPKKTAWKPTPAQQHQFQQTINSAKQTIQNVNERNKNMIEYSKQRMKHPFGQPQVQIGFKRKNTPTVFDNRNLVQGRDEFNPKTGKLEPTYLTASGNKYNSKVMADAEQRQIDDAMERELQRRQIEEEKKNDPSLWETITKSLGAGFTRAGAGILDAVHQLTSGMIVEDGSSPTGYTKTKSYEDVVDDDNNAFSRDIGNMYKFADRWSKESQPYGGHLGFLDLLWSGDIGGFLQKGVATAGESLPMTLSAFNPYTMALNAISMAGANYRERTLKDPSVPAWKRALMATGSAAIEQAVEKYADPVFKYVGANKILKGSAKEASEKIVTDVTQEATKSLAQRIYRALGGLAKDAAGEGVEEVVTNVGNDALGELLDVVSGDKDYGLRAQWEQKKEDNPDASLWDFAVDKAKENIESFIGGAMAGAYTSGTTQLTTKGLEYAFGGSHAGMDEKTGVISPVTHDISQSYDEGYASDDSVERRDFSIGMQQAEQRARETFDEQTMESLQNNPEETLSQIGDPADQQVALDYLDRKASYDGMMKRIEEDADAMAAQQRELYKQMQHKTDGSLRPAVLKEKDSEGNDQQVYIVDGNVQMMPDGSMVDKAASDNIVVVCNPATGESKQIDPSADTGISSLGEVITAEQREADIERMRQEYVQSQIDEAHGTVRLAPGQQIVLPTGEEAVVMSLTPVPSPNGEGRSEDTDVVVALGDGTQTTVRLSELQRIRDEKAAADYRQRHGSLTPDPSPKGEGSEMPQAGAGGVVAGAPADYTAGMELTIRDEDGEEKPAMVMGMFRMEATGPVADADGKLVGFLIDGEPHFEHVTKLGDKVVSHTEERAVPKEMPQYSLDDDVYLQTDDGEIHGNVIAEENPDGLITIQSEQPIGGRIVNLFTREQLDSMTGNNAVENISPQVNISGENIPQEPVEAPVTPSEPTQTEQPTAEPMPMIGEGEDAEPDFGATTPQRAHDYIFNESGLDEADATEFTKNNVDAANKELEKIKNRKPKMGTSIAKFNKDKAVWERKVNEAQAKADYWKQVKAARDKVLADRLAEQQERERQQIEQAQADEAAYREEMARKEVEQAALGTNNVSPAIREKWASAPKIEGAQDEIVLPNGEKVAGRYYLVESGAASASHDSSNGFVKTEGFPVDENGGSVNDRDYERDKDAQQVTRDIANNYDSRAVQTPVVVSQDGVVLSGNGRTMAGELAAAHNTDAAYNSHIAQYPTKWGFTKQQVEGMQHPRVVFVPDAAMPYTAETFAKFNQQEMKGQSKTEQAVKLGKVVSDKAFNRIIRIINRFDTLGDFYSDSKATSEAIAELQGDGVLSQAQLAEMVDGGGISAIGKELLENTLIGKAFESNPNAVREITEYKSMRQSIITALAEISNNLSLDKEYSLESELAQAIDLVYQARKSGSKLGEPVSWFARQQNLDFFGLSDTVADYNNATMLMIADIINDNRSSLLKKYIQIYNHNAKDSANGQLDLFTGSVKGKGDIINEVKQLFSNGSEEEQQKAAQEAVARRKAESIQENGTVANGSEGSDEDNDRVEETPAEQTPTEEDGSKPVMSHDEKMAFMRQFLEDTAGDMRLLDVVTDEEVQKLIDLYDAWEVVNDGLGAAHDANDALLNNKNKAIAQKAKENIETAENAANAAFAPVEDYYNELCDKYGITDEEEPAANATGTVAAAITEAEAATEVNPTDAQKEAGNYKKGHVRIDGFDITIENPKGSVRRGTDASGKQWEQEMQNTYGYIRGTEGVDGDHIDVFFSEDPSQGDVFVVDQVNKDGSFDEHKVMYGFPDIESARKAYLSNYEDGWQGLGAITPVSKEEFKKWIDSSHRKTKPFAEYKNVKVEGNQRASLRQQKVFSVDDVSPRESAMRDALVDLLRGAGVEVVTDVEEGQRVLDEANDGARMQAKKRALETASVTSNEKHQPTVVSSADGAKVLKNLDKLVEDFEKLSNQSKFFTGTVAKAIGATRHNSKSEYATFETKNGRVVTIRLADHNATVSNFDMRGELDGISIVVSPKKSAGVTNDGDAHVVEYYYDAIKLRRADGKPLADIVRSIKQALYSGEFKDTTGLAVRQDMNADEVRFFRTADGHAYGFTAGDQIYIDPRIATAETPIHEYSHLWSYAMRELNPEEWANIVELMKGTTLWEQVKHRYSELKTEDEIADEVLAQYSGRRGAERLRAEQEKIAKGDGDAVEKAKAISALERVRDALKRFWKGVADWFGIHFTSAEEVADKVLSDLLNGVNPVSAMKSKDGGVRYEANSEEAGIVAKAKAEGTYMKAPNGKPSRLTPRQWVQVRTKAFKEWFGDWEKAAKVLNVVPAFKEHGFKNFDDARSWAKEHIVRTLTDEETGGKGEIRISNNAVAKFLSESAVAKSDSKDVHLSVLKVLPDVIRESVDAEQHPDYKKGEDGSRSVENGVNEHVTIHRLYGAVNVDGKTYMVKVTMKEDRTNNEPQKAYSYEATKIELLAGQHEEAVTSSRNSNNSITAANLLQNVEKSYGNGEKLLDCSKIVDENGEPRVVYHQTNSTIFVNKETGENFDDLNWKEKDYWQNEASEEEWNDTWEEQDFYVFDNKTHGRRSVEMPAFFFSPVYDEYHEYGERTVTAFLNIRNPIVNPDIPNRGVTDTAGEDAMNALIAQGYDGFIREYDGEVEEINAFFPNQIKSAEENVGTFDGENPDIRYQFVGEKGAAAMDKAEEASVRLDNLAVAREMENAGKDAKAVKLATGWERGGDGKWRYEIEDFDSSGLENLVREDNKKKLRLSEHRRTLLGRKWEMESEVYPDRYFDEFSDAEREQWDRQHTAEIAELNDLSKEIDRLKKQEESSGIYTDLGTVVGKDHVLFKYYPELEGAVVHITDMPSSVGGNYKPGVITLNRGALYDSSILNHEVQHAIQEIEGFARGGSVRDVRKRIMKRISELDGVSEHAKDMLARQVEYQALASKLGYVYERLMKNGEDWAVRAASGFYWDAMNTLDNDENSKLENAYPKGMNASEIAKEGFNRDKAIEELNRLSDYYASQISAEDMKNIKESETLSGKIDGKSDEELYHALGGEVEARNVQSRLGMTAEERRASLASETEDVARDDQIFLEDGLGESMSESNAAATTESTDTVRYRIPEDEPAKVKRTMQEDRDMMRSAVQQMGEKLHTNINIIEDVNKITHPNAAVQERRRKSKGWYDTATGQVYIVLPNNRDIDDVKASVGHETIAHKGLRELVGEENYDVFLDETYQHLRDDLKKGVDDAAGRAFVDDATKNGKRAKSYEQHRRTAVDELFGRLAEKPFEEFSEGERTLWQKLKAAVRKLLDKFLGSLKLPKWFELGDNELRYILWRSKERLERGKEHPIDLALDIVKREELGLTDEARYNMGDAPETFKARQRRAVENNGTVMPGLNDAQVKVVDVPRHSFTGTGRQAIDKAKIWANGHLVGTHTAHQIGNVFDYNIDEDAIDKFLSSSSTLNSENLGVHLAVLSQLPNVINNSVEVEEHPDYKKVNGKRKTENGVGDSNLLVHRMYGAVQIDGNTYRVKTTMHEHYVKGNAPHDYRVTKIELLISGSPTSNALSNSIGEVLDGQTTKPLSVSSRKSNTPNGVELLDSTDGERTGLSSSYQSNSNGSHTSKVNALVPVAVAKVIKNVEKSYDTGKKLLDESKLADESTDLYRDPEETEDIWNDQSLGLQERITAAATRLANNHRDNKTLRHDAMRAIGGNLSDLRKAMSLQRTFDMTTVKRVSDLARVLITNGYINNATSYEIKRLLSAVKNSVGHNDIEGDVQKVMDIMVDNQLKHAEETLHSLEAIKGSKVDARGVEVQGKLDPDGQTLIKAMKEAQKIVNPCGGKTHDEKGEPTAWGNALESAQMRMSSNDQAVADAAAIEYAGMQMAQQWFDTIQQSKLEEHELRQMLKSGYVDENGNPIDNPQGKREWRANIEESIRQNKIERVQAYYELVGRLTDSMRGSIANAKAFKEAEKQRIREIQHNANSDMEGRELRGHRGDSRLDRLNESWLVRFGLSPLHTFDQFMRLFGRKNADGKGYLYDHYMRKFIGSADHEQLMKEKYEGMLQDKVDELFGTHRVVWNGGMKKVPYTYTALYGYVDALPMSKVTYYDGAAMREYDLSQAQLGYLYAVDKMPMGKATNRRMCVTDEVMEQIADMLDPKLKEFIDWMQEDFLVGLGNECNEVHKRMFGANMANIENYFPFVRDKNAIKREVENGESDSMVERISTKTGAIIKRTPSVAPWDLPNANILDVLAKHVSEMCQWSSYAELNRDLGTLQSYNRFKQQVLGMRTIYGSGENLWKRFMQTCAIVGNAYEPKRGEADKLMVKGAKGITMGKIAFRPMTAMKQLLSLPAFFGEVDIKTLSKDFATGGIPSVKWAWENMPNFRKRIKSRTTGDFRLSATKYDKEKGWTNRLMQIASYGMLPNIGVDAWTIALGSHAVYVKAKKKYLRQGYSEEKAERRAVQDAELCFNKSQQSSEGAFMAPVQIDHTFASTTMMLFRNSSTSYTRECVTSVRNLKRMMSGKVDVDFMAKQILRNAEIPTYSVRFDKELQQQVDGKLPVGHIYSLGMPGGILQSAGFPDAPIELSSTRLADKASQTEHPFPIEAVKGLVDAMNKPIAVFKYGNNAMNVILGLEYNGKQFLVGVHFNQYRGGTEVSSVRGLFPKDNAEWLNWISQGKATYLDHKKIKALIAQQRINLADVDYLDLKDVTKVMKNFVNPDIPEQKYFAGWREEDVKHALKQARKDYRGAYIRNSVNAVMFGYILPWLWRIGGLGVLLTLGGDDDEKVSEVEKASKQSLFGPLEGLAYGDVLADALYVSGNKLIGDGSEKFSNLGRTNPFYSDLSTVLRKLDRDKMSAINDVLNMLVGINTGVNLQTVSDWATAILDYSPDGDTAREVSLLVARLLNAPQSQIEKIYFDEIGMSGEEASKLSPKELVERYAAYKVKRDHFVTPWVWGDEALLDKKREKGIDIVKERVERLGDDKLQDVFDGGDMLLRSLAAKEGAKRLGGTDSYGSPQNEYGQVYLQMRDYVDLAEDVMLQAALKKAKDSGNTDRAKDIESARRQITEVKKDLTEVPYTLSDGTEVTAKDIMQELRDLRKNLLNELGITTQQQPNR